MDFDLRLLRHARALAEEGSFARAARTLHLTQPALSRSIQELERRTGIALFARNKGRVDPTDLGRVFIAHARELLARAEALDREVATLRGSGTGSLHVGSGTLPSSMFMAAAASNFLRRNPGVAIRFANDNWASLIAALRRRELDFVVSALPADDEAADLIARPLSPRQGYFLVRPGHPVLANEEPSLADILAYPLVSTGRMTHEITASLIAARKQEDSRRPIVEVACESTDMMRHIAAATDHVLLSSLAAQIGAIERGELVAIPAPDPRISVKFAVIRLLSRTLPPIAEELIASVIAADRASAATERALATRLLDSRAASARPATSKRRRQGAHAAAVR